MIDTIKAIPELKGQDAVLKKIDDIAKLWEDKMLLTAYNIIKDRVHDLELHRPFHGYSCIFRHPKKVGYLELSI
jgi:hypothetical protein